jgi:hypothetical protein
MIREGGNARKPSTICYRFELVVREIRCIFFVCVSKH